MMRTEHLEYDWLVIGSGFGGSTSALRLAEKGYRVAVLECGRRFADEDFARTHLGRGQVLLDAEAGDEGHLPPDAVQGHLRGLGLRCRRRVAWVRQHALSRPPRVLHRSADRGARGLGGGARAPLRRGRADAGRGQLRPGHRRRPVAQGVRAAARVRRHVRQDAGGRVPGRGGQDRSRPVLRRRGAGADRLRALRAVHDRLPLRREEHADQELFVLGRAAWRAGDAGTDRVRHPPAPAPAMDPTATWSGTSAPAPGCVATDAG